MQIFWIGFSVVGGIIFYQEIEAFTTRQWVGYPIAFVLGGIGMVQPDDKVSEESYLMCVSAGIYYLTVHGSSISRKQQSHVADVTSVEAVDRDTQQGYHLMSE